MRVSRLINGDWTFGKGLANYTSNGAAINQNITTRLKSFKNDWFLDTEANIDWLNILGQKNNKDTIESEIRRVVLATEGVLTIDSFDSIEQSGRELTVQLSYTNVYNENIQTRVGI